MAVYRDRRLLNVRHAGLERANDPGIVRGRGVTHCVRNVYSGGAGFDHGLDDVAQKVDLGAGGIFGREFDVLAEAACEAYALHGLFNNLLASHAQLVFTVNGRRGQEDVNARLLGELKGFPGAGDVAFIGTGQAADGGAGDFGGDGADGLKVAV